MANHLQTHATILAELRQAMDTAVADGEVYRSSDERGRHLDRLHAINATIEFLQIDFQRRVKPWMLECFGEIIAGDRQERSHRFIEEALELIQAVGCTASEAHQLIDYVFGRPAGEPRQEIGGVMVTLAALCLAHGLDMHEAGEVELARIWTKVDTIRAKQAAKPKHSPLPETVRASAPQTPDFSWRTPSAVADVIAERKRQVEEEGWTADHDDQHLKGGMARAAAVYARFAAKSDAARSANPPGHPPHSWAWGRSWWKPKDRRRDLVRAAALILAEIERLDRISASSLER